ncbi:hypothetical protein [Thaumasiovibrio subtropicus]|uniref:hypothetical protein n=1 Tax=Thaumasiovibrio subtropicus TaxID=1891207 RepID=UPI000B3632B6|nr:hypothetical protein [Thaumasiovibrio subtropicus]
MTLKKTALATAILTGLLGVTACSDSDSFHQSYTPPPAVDPVGHSLTLTLIDSEGNLLTNAATVTLSGKGAQYLSKQTVDPATTSELSFPLEPSDSGTLNLLIDDSISQEADTQVITAVVESTGYTSTSTLIRIDPRSPESAFVSPVQLVKFDESVNETDKAVVFAGAKKEINEDATLPEAIEIDTGSAATDGKDNTALAGGAAKLVISTDAVLQDANGNAVSGSNIDVRMNYFSNEPRGTGEASASALDSFPGGFNVASAAVEGSDDTVDDFAFISAGFVAIDITTDEGEAVKRFGVEEGGEPVVVQMRVPADTIWQVDLDEAETSLDQPQDWIGKSLIDIADAQDNPDETISIPTWSYEESTGEWTKSKHNSVVTLNTESDEHFDKENNVFITEMKVEHLSYWNLDWVQSQRCSTPTRNIDIVFQDGQTPNVVNFYPTLRASGFSGTGFFSETNPERLTITYTPDIEMTMQLLIDGESKIEGVRVNGGSFTTAGVENGAYTGSLCALDAVKLSLSTDDLTTITPQINVQAMCEQDNSIVKSQPAYIRVSGNRYYHSANTSTGAAEFPSVVADNLDLNVYTFVNGNGYGAKTTNVSLTESNQTYTVNYMVQCEVDNGGTGGTGGTGGDGGAGGGDS